MPAARSHLYSASLALGICAALAPLACGRADVHPVGGAPPSDVPRGGDTGIKPPAPVAGPAGQTGSPPAGAGSGPAVHPTEGGEACAMEAHQAERLTVDLLVLLDVSASMADEVEGGTRSKAELASEALISFIKDPRSAGSGVGLEFFPLRPQELPPVMFGIACQADADCPKYYTCPHSPGVRRECEPPVGAPQCHFSTYEKPTVPIATLPAGEAPLVQALQKLPFGSDTPMGPAVQGALNQLRTYQAANPTHRVALVLATDGLAGACKPNNPAGLAALVSLAATETPSIATYTIGVFGANQTAQGRAALQPVSAAGGTDMPFVLNSDPDLARTFEDTLEKIRGAALPCDYVIPPPSGPIDFGKVNVRVQAAAGTGEDIPYVTAAARCDPMRGGWYYDVDPARATPTRVVTCPATCDRLKAEASASVSLVFGCKTRVIE
jgi:hypothetical protein